MKYFKIQIIFLIIRNPTKFLNFWNVITFKCCRISNFCEKHLLLCKEILHINLTLVFLPWPPITIICHCKREITHLDSWDSILGWKQRWKIGGRQCNLIKTLDYFNEREYITLTTISFIGIIDRRRSRASTIRTPLPRNKSYTTLQSEFHLNDICEYMKNGMEVSIFIVAVLLMVKVLLMDQLADIPYY